MKKFEYKKIKMSFYSLSEEDLNMYGKEGWELCGISDNRGITYIFKREVK